MQKRGAFQSILSSPVANALTKRAQAVAPAAARYLYGALIFAVGGAAVWLGFIFTNSSSLAAVRPAMHASLGSLGIFFGGEQPGPALEPATANGQVVALNDLDIKTPVSGRISMIAAQGTEVAEGDVIARLDDVSARASLRSAEASLATARHELEQARGNASAVSTAPSETPSPDQALVALSDVHVNLAWIVPRLQSVLYGKDIKPSRGNAYAYADFVAAQHEEVNGFRDRALEDAQNLNSRYTALVAQYRAISRDSSGPEIEAAMNETYDILKETADALKTTNDFLVVIEEQFEAQGQDELPLLDEHQEGIASALVTTNDSIEQLALAIERIRPAAAPAPLDTRSYELAVAEAESDVAAAREELDKFVIRAPMAGRISSVDVARGASVLNGEILARIMTEQNVARVAFSEKDVGKVHQGDAAEVNFEGAGFSLEGVVLAIDPAATIADDNVWYYSIISFDSNDERVRPGMTVRATVR